jgi:hypothetical protein
MPTALIPSGFMSRFATVVAYGVSAFIPWTTAAQAAGPMVPVGVARVDITPSYPIRLNGYSDRKSESEGVEEKIFAKALAIGDDATGPAVLVSVENCGVRSNVTEVVAQRLQAKAHLARERFVVASTHSHTAPCLGGGLPLLFGAPLPNDQQERIERYTQELTDRIEQVALAALRDRRPGTLAWGQGAVGFATNRRVLKDGRWVNFGAVPDGPVDRSLPVLRLTDPNGKLRAVLLGYACHCTTLKGAFNKVCGDWAGYAQEAIERENPGAVALVLIGCAADADPQPRGELRFAKEHGDEVAREVDRLLRSKLTPLPGSIDARFRRIELPFAPPPNRQEFAERARQAGPVGHHARTQLERLDRGESLPTVQPYPVQTWCFGDDLTMIFLGGEVVVDYALRLKRELDPARVWASAYCNDVPCYIASKRVLREGGYEADASMIYYDRPTRFAPAVEDRIIEAVHGLVPKSFERRGP